MTAPDRQPAFSIITPSFNMLDYLKRCCASVADQREVSFEHIVMDACSTDGTAEWLRQNKRIVSVVKEDHGMYDALNSGFELARGEIISYLNCDEQYLPGTLGFVRDYFRRHPEADLLFGDCLLIRPDGSLIAHRKGYAPRWPLILASHLYVLSCTMFLRREIIDDGFRFDDRLKAIGDQDLVVRLLRSGWRAAHVRRYLAAFTMTGSNLSEGENAQRERKEALAAAPLWIRSLKCPLNAIRLALKTASGAYFQKMPLAYAVYDSADATGRRRFEVQRSSFRWKAD